MPNLTAETIGQIVDQWFVDHISAPPIAQNTAAFNQAHAAKEVLKERLQDALDQPETPAPAPAAVEHHDHQE